MKKNHLFSILVILTTAIIFLYSCSKESNGTQADAGSATGVGGSLARFTIAAGHLYIADWGSIQVYSLANPGAPAYVRTVSVGFGVETIFPYGRQLFIGSQVGMFIYSLDDASNPKLLGKALHMRACDPVVANDTVAFVTLRGGTPCGTATDGLYVYNIKNSLEPKLIKQVDLVSPGGLGLKNNILYVCQKENGMTLYNVQDPSKPIEVLKVKPANRQFMDVIPYGDLLICYVDNGILLYDIADPSAPKMLTNVVNY